MPSNRNNIHIYDKRIQEFEKEIINFSVEYGKNKRSEIESHILTYFLLREGQWLTQENLRELSLLFYEKQSKKGISRGSISKILNNYVEYRLLNKRKLDAKKNAFEYSLSGAFNQVMSSAIEFGIEEMDKYIFFLNEKLTFLEQIKYKNEEAESLRVILIERVIELRNFFKFHKNIYSDIFKKPDGNNDDIKKVENIQVNKPVRDIEREIIEFIVNCPLLRFVDIKEAYYPIIAYFFTRKQLSQEKIKDLTRISAGMVSEGLNYLLQEGYIELNKVKGVRIRSYELNSIAYYQYLYLFRIFKSNSELLTGLNVLYIEIKAEKDELKTTKGYKNIERRVKQFLVTRPIIERLSLAFKDAMEKFKKNDNCKKLKV